MFRRACVTCVLVLAGVCARSEDGRRLALLIGARECRDPRLHQLWFCEDDIHGLAGVLQTLDFAPENIAILSGQAVREKKSDAFQSTLANMRAALLKLCADATPADTVLFAYSGHGVQFKRDGRIFFCPIDSTLDNTASLFSLEELFRILKTNCKAKTKLILIDACRNDPTDARPLSAVSPADPELPSGCAVFFGCSRGQGSFETGLLWNSVFYHVVIQGLGGAARDVAGEITVPSLEDYLAREVPATNERYRKTLQIPEFRSTLHEALVLSRAESPIQKVASNPPNAAPEVIAVQGAGATLAAPLHVEWATAYNKAHADIHGNFRSGNVSGIKALKARTAHFAVSDVPLTDGELKTAPEILQIPTVSTAVVPIYNLPSVQNLKLDGPTLAGIYLGKIKSWNDAKIAALNPGMTLPRSHIVVVHRSDDTSTSRNFTNYLAGVSEEWRKNIGAVATKWPIGAPGERNEGVAWIVANVDGAIGYVELAFAEKEQPPALALPNDKSVKAARFAVARVLGADDPYPIRGTTYLLVHQDVSYFKNLKTAEALVNYLHWCESSGMEMARPAYGPLSTELRKQADELLKSIIFEGKPVYKSMAERDNFDPW